MEDPRSGLGYHHEGHEVASTNPNDLYVPFVVYSRRLTYNAQHEMAADSLYIIRLHNYHARSVSRSYSSDGLEQLGFVWDYSPRRKRQGQR